MKINQLKGGSVLAYLQMALRVIIGIAYTPVMLKLLGQSEYGLYNTAASTISMMSILSLGFNSSYVRYYAQYKVCNDEEAIAKLNGLFLIIFVIIGIIAMLCGTLLANNLELVFAQGLTAAEYDTAKILMLLLTVNLAISFPMSVFQSIISAHERYIVLKLLAMMKTVLGPFLTLPLLLMGFRSIAMVLVTITVALITDMVYLIYCRKVLHVKFSFRGFEMGIFKNLLVFTSFIAINLFVDQVNSNMGRFLLARYQGTVAVAVYSVGYTLYQYYVMFSTAISGVFAPKIHHIVNATRENNSEQKKQLTELFTRVGRIQFLVLGLVASGIIFFGKSFIAFWAGDGYSESYSVALLLILPAMVPLIQNIGIEIQRAQYRHQFRSIVYLLMAAVNCLLSIVLCKKYGATGAAIGTAISLMLANGVAMNMYYHLKCNINILYFWKQILQLARGLVLPVLCGMAQSRWMHLDSVAAFLVGVLLYTIAYISSMWLFGMNPYEKNLIAKPIRKIFLTATSKRWW